MKNIMDQSGGNYRLFTISRSGNKADVSFDYDNRIGKYIANVY